MEIKEGNRIKIYSKGKIDQSYVRANVIGVHKNKLLDPKAEQLVLELENGSILNIEVEE